MEAYDNILILSLFSLSIFPKVRKEISWKYEITAWQSALGCGNSIGIIIAWHSGVLVVKYGHRKVVIINMFFMAAFISSLYLPEMSVLLLVKFSMVSWGFFCVIGLILCFEVAPLPLRGFLSAYVMMCWATGGEIIAAAGVESYVAQHYSMGL